MNITILAFTDGRRDCISRTIPSFTANWDWKIRPTRMIIINDSADPDYANWLDETFPEWERIHHLERSGFGGAIQSGWDHVTTDFVFHLEDDFVFHAPINPRHLIEILDNHPNLVQLAFKRQPWNAEENAAGDLMGVHPNAWTPHSYQTDDGTIVRWSGQRMFFTTNPSMYRGELTKQGWPVEQYSEGVFSHRLMADPAITFGMLGWPGDSPKIQHIGDERIGTGY